MTPKQAALRGAKANYLTERSAPVVTLKEMLTEVRDCIANLRIEQHCHMSIEKAYDPEIARQIKVMKAIQAVLKAQKTK